MFWFLTCYKEEREKHVLQVRSETTDGRCSWLSSHAGSQNPLGRDRQEKSTHTKLDSQGYPGNAFAHFTKKWREKHGFPVEGILNVRRVCEVCIPNSCLFTFF